MELLKENHITLELCPTSNLNTKVVDSIGQYPIRQLMDAGVAVTINTDNMTVSDTCIQHEYQLLADTFAFGDTQIKEFLYHAAEASFTTDAKGADYIYVLKDTRGKFIVYALCCDRKGKG